MTTPDDLKSFVSPEALNDYKILLRDPKRSYCRHS